jgi:uncharacterized protein YjbJ (UPF0337 family)
MLAAPHEYLRGRASSQQVPFSRLLNYFKHGSGFAIFLDAPQAGVFGSNPSSIMALKVPCLVLASGWPGSSKGLAANSIRPGGSMKPSTKDQIAGKLLEMKGKVKEKAGQVTNNPDLAAEGQADRLVGKVQKKVGQIEKVFEK